jgi:Spy/CpxP family protein refolding chaperone
LEMLSKQLNLTDEQKPQVKTVLEEQQKKFIELRDATPEQRQAARDEIKNKMKTILTAEQFQKWENMASRIGGRRATGGTLGSHPEGENKPDDHQK